MVNIWSTPIYRGCMDSITDDEIESSIDVIYNLARRSKGNILSNVGGWQSHSCSIGDHPVIERMIAKFYPFIDQVALEYDFKLEICNYWININYTNNHNSRHTHPDTAFAGVFYLNNEEDHGDIVFSKPGVDLEKHILRSQKMHSYIKKNCSNFVIKPQKKDILMFPGFIPHQVQPNLSEKPRISMAFNTVVVQ